MRGPAMLATAVSHQLVEDCLRAAPDQFTDGAPKRFIGQSLAGDLFRKPFHGDADCADKTLTGTLFNDLFQ